MLRPQSAGGGTRCEQHEGRQEEQQPRVRTTSVHDLLSVTRTTVDDQGRTRSGQHSSHTAPCLARSLIRTSFFIVLCLLLLLLLLFNEEEEEAMLCCSMHVIVAIINTFDDAPSYVCIRMEVQRRCAWQTMQFHCAAL